MTITFGQGLLLITPIAIGTILNYITIGLNPFQFLKVPISINLFGENKTWRGIISIIFFTVFGSYITYIIDQNFTHYNLFTFQNFLSIGFITGLGWCLGELPNSYLKRKFGISSGQMGKGIEGFLFIIANQIDSPIGCVILGAIFCFKLTLFDCIWIILLAGLLHFIGNAILYKMGIRKSTPY